MFAIARHGIYLGIVVGPEARVTEWNRALSKFRARAAYVRSLPGHLGDRVRAYEAFAVSVTLFDQFVAMRDEFSTVEAATLASLLAAPMRALTQEGHDGGLCFRSTALCSHRGSGGGHPLEDGLDDGEPRRNIARIADVDAAMLQPSTPGWIASSACRQLCRARTRAMALPPSIRDAARPQAAVVRHLLQGFGDAPLLDFLSRRLHTLLREAPAPQDVDLVMLRLRWAFSDLPFSITLSLLRFVANAWPTTRRMGGVVGRCLLGCEMVGGDSVHHNFRCPAVLVAMRSSVFFTPGWAIAGSFETVASLVSVTRRAASNLTVWGYVWYRVYADARHMQRPHTPRSVREVFTPAGRSLGTGSPALRPRLSRVGLRRG